MFRKIGISRIFFTIGLIAALSFSVLADTIRLKDGSIIKGKITGFSGGKFTVVIGEGSRSRQMSFSAAEIESIQFDSPMSEPGIETVSKTSSANNPQIVQASLPPVSIPRVITTDTTRSVPETVKPAKVETPAVVAGKPSTTTGNAKPIEVSVKVLADNSSNGWTNSGWVVKKGQKIRIIGKGDIMLGGGKSTGASGKYDIDDETKLLKSVPTGALIAVIGDDNNEFIYIGSERTFTATRDGALFLGVNEGNLNDNSGVFDVTIEIEPA